MPAHAVQVLRPAGAVLVDLLDELDRLGARQAHGALGGLNALLHAAQDPHPEHVADAGQEQVAGVAVVDQVAAERLLTQAGGGGRQIELALAGVAPAAGGRFDHGGFELADRNAAVDRRIGQELAIDALAAELRGQGLGQQLAAAQGSARDRDDRHRSSSLDRGGAPGEADRDEEDGSEGSESGQQGAPAETPFRTSVTNPVDGKREARNRRPKATWLP